MDADSGNVKQVTDVGFASRPRWSDGRRLLYTKAVGLDVNTSFPVIATLPQKRRQEVNHWKPIKVPPMPFETAAFSADGKSILFSGEIERRVWNIYRFELSGYRLIQLTDNPAEDTTPREGCKRKGGRQIADVCSAAKDLGRVSFGTR